MYDILKTKGYDLGEKWGYMLTERAWTHSVFPVHRSIILHVISPDGQEPDFQKLQSLYTGVLEKADNSRAQIIVSTFSSIFSEP